MSSGRERKEVVDILLYWLINRDPYNEQSCSPINFAGAFLLVLLNFGEANLDLRMFGCLIKNHKTYSYQMVVGFMLMNPIKSNPFFNTNKNKSKFMLPI